ncbi:hypothetical protein CLCR_10310 [Cladophialophora carrionii]|uniref:Uncharacterized protein n=1 Tax=Cladophialophora carrionii TaxID=86049 RepID=A0A1C1CXP2_9EURO|nr:hypothetical protein CLCR_10310 [Cladophialophora carrionii]
MARKLAHQRRPSSEGRSISPSNASASSSAKSEHLSPTLTNSSDAQDVQEELHEHPSATDERVPESTRPGPQPMPHDPDHTDSLTQCTRLIIDGRVLYIEGNRTVYIDTGRRQTTVSITDHAEFVDERFPTVCERCNGYGKQPLLHRSGGSSVRSLIPCTDCEGLGAIFREDHDQLLPGSEPRRGRHSNSARQQGETSEGQGSHFRQSLTDESERDGRMSLPNRAVSTNGESQTAATRGPEGCESPADSTSKGRVATGSRQQRTVTGAPICDSSGGSQNGGRPRSDAVPARLNARHARGYTAEKDDQRGTRAIHPDPLSDRLPSRDGHATTFNDGPNPQSPYYSDRSLHADQDDAQQVRNDILSRLGGSTNRRQGFTSQAEAHRFAPETSPYKWPRTARPARLSLNEMNQLSG